MAWIELLWAAATPPTECFPHLLYTRRESAPRRRSRVPGPHEYAVRFRPVDSWDRKPPIPHHQETPRPRRALHRWTNGLWIRPRGIDSRSGTGDALTSTNACAEISIC